MRIVSILLLLVAVIVYVGVQSARAEYGVINTKNIGANGTYVSPDVFTGLPIIDDFDDGGWMNNLQGKYSVSTDTAGNGVCTFSNDASVVASGYALKLTYNVTAQNCYAAFVSPLKASNFSPYGVLSFDVRGAVGGEYFKIQLKSNNGLYKQSSVMITDVMSKTCTTSWQTVTIPFIMFFNITDFSSMNELVLVFENYQCTTNGSPVTGTIYIDNFKVLSGSTLTSLFIDNFNDKVGACSLGGNMVDSKDTTVPATTVSHSFNGGELVSTVSIGAVGSWAGHTLILGGGDDGWQENDDWNYSRGASWWRNFNGVSIKSYGFNSPNVKFELRIYVPSRSRWFNAYQEFNPNGTTVTAGSFTSAVGAGNIAGLWADLIANGYVDGSGVVLDAFWKLSNASAMILAPAYESARSEIYAILQQTSGGGTLLFTNFIYVPDPDTWNRPVRLSNFKTTVSHLGSKASIIYDRDGTYASGTMKYNEIKFVQ